MFECIVAMCWSSSVSILNSNVHRQQENFKMSVC